MCDRIVNHIFIHKLDALLMTHYLFLIVLSLLNIDIILLIC